MAVICMDAQIHYKVNFCVGQKLLLLLLLRQHVFYALPSFSVCFAWHKRYVGVLSDHIHDVKPYLGIGAPVNIFRATHNRMTLEISIKLEYFMWNRPSVCVWELQNLDWMNLY